jgi:DNA-binding XRE family transcriptional regulator
MTNEQNTKVGTLRLAGDEFVVLSRRDYELLLTRAGEANVPPPIPAKLPGGNYPAVESMRAVMARRLIHDRRRLGLSQAELARRAGVKIETLNRIERARVTASVGTMIKLDAVLNRVGHTRVSKRARKAARRSAIVSAHGKPATGRKRRPML